MKPLCLVLVGVVVGWAASGVAWTRDAVGQDAPAFAPPAPQGVVIEAPAPAGAAPRTGPVMSVPRTVINNEGRPITVWDQIPAGGEPAAPQPIGRFQISAYGTATTNGCYVVDSATGKIWFVDQTLAPRLLTKKLPLE